MINLLDESIVFMIFVSLADALVGGFLQGLMQTVGWNQKINDIYKIIIFLLTVSFAVFIVEYPFETYMKLAVLYVLYFEDVLYYFWLPLLRVFHPWPPRTRKDYVYNAEPIPVPMFYLPAYMQGLIGFVARIFKPGFQGIDHKIVKVLAIGSVIIVYFI